MKTRYKIILIVCISCAVILGGIVIGPVIFMVAANAYSNLIISSTPDETFEEEFAEIPEVKFFIEKYPNYSAYHFGDFLGWKVISYESKGDKGKSINLYVKKSVLNQGVKISAGCNDGSHSFTFDILQEQVMDYLKNNECLVK